MDHELAVLVPVDLHGACGPMAVTGCPIEDDQHVPYPLVRRPRMPVPDGLPSRSHILCPATRPPEASGWAG